MTNFDEIDKLRIFIIDEQQRPRSQSWYFKSKGNGVYIGPEKTGRALKLSFHTDNGRARDGRNSQWGLITDQGLRRDGGTVGHAQTSATGTMEKD